MSASRDYRILTGGAARRRRAVEASCLDVDHIHLAECYLRFANIGRWLTLATMSSAQDTAATATAFQSELTWNYWTFAALSLAAYEYFCTIDHEITLMWRRKWTAATYFFCTNRYFMLVTVIIAAVPYTHSSVSLRRRKYRTRYRLTGSVDSCTDSTRSSCYNLPLQLFLCALDLIPVIIAAVFSALRVFAMLDHARWILSGSVLLLGLIPVIVNAYSAHWVAYEYVNDPVLGSACYTYFAPIVTFRTNLYCELDCNNPVM
ncbi:hypothetical protein NM688_g9320 [Phlebia brevispora]|uniref:Uncharacterized protein n=1 Tax=Phlebia brevispora TaxID=194682 RepID=A0ACC1RKI8_9APHY|nr:hypothetical protein NM688_g9320 [Phlebia brevispora]